MLILMTRCINSMFYLCLLHNVMLAVPQCRVPRIKEMKMMEKVKYLNAQLDKWKTYICSEDLHGVA